MYWLVSLLYKFTSPRTTDISANYNSDDNFTDFHSLRQSLRIAADDQMVALVEQMLSLHKQLSDTKTGHERTVIQRQIDATDQQIDQLV